MGNPPPRRAKRTGVAHSLTASTGGVSAKEQQVTFIGASGEPLNALCMAHGQANAEIAEENAPTLSCNHEAPLVCTEPRAVYCCDARGNGDGETANTITGDHAGHANDYMPVVAFTANDNGRDCMNECSPTLRKGGETPADGGAIVPAVVESEPLAFIKNDAGGDQDGYWRGVFPTLRTEITPAVAYDTIQLDPLETPVVLGGDKMAKAERKGGSGLGVSQDGVMYTQTEKDVHAVAYNATVRRLLPIETERLMGFPDNHTLVPWKGKPESECPDSARYKACGNSMCVNVMQWLGYRIQMVENEIQKKEPLCLNTK